MWIFGLLCTSCVFAQENPSFIASPQYAGSIPRREAVLLFTGMIPRWPDGTPVTVVMRSITDSMTQAFSQETLNMYPYQIEIIITRRKIAGEDVRRIFVNTNAEMILTVQTTKGAIGYGITSNSDLIMRVTNK